MSVIYSGSSIVNNTFTTGSSTPSGDWLTAVAAAMVSAGWTKSNTPASDVLTFSGQPANNDTVTLDQSPNNRTYTFKTSLTGAAYEVLIGASTAVSIQNLQAAVNGAAGAGTTYGTGTVAHPTMTASAITTTTLTVSFLTGGSDGNTAPVSKSGANLSWAATSLNGGYTLLLSATTPQGLQCSVKFYLTAGSFYNPGTSINTYVGDRYQIHVSNYSLTFGSPSAVPVTTNFRVIATKYHVFVFAIGTINNQTPGYAFSAGVPYIPSFMVAPTITAATNANPIVCTIANHGWTTGQSIFAQGALGNTAVNGTNIITVIDANTFSIPVAGNGTYTANSAQASNLTLADTIVEAIWGDGTGPGGPNNLRSGSNAASYAFTSVNGQMLQADQSVARLALVLPMPATNTNVPLQWYNNNFVLSEPLVVWGVANNATPKVIGQLFDAVVVRKDLNLEQTATFDGHNWIGFNSESTPGVTLMLAMT